MSSRCVIHSFFQDYTPGRLAERQIKEEWCLDILAVKRRSTVLHKIEMKKH